MFLSGNAKTEFARSLVGDRAAIALDGAVQEAAHAEAGRIVAVEGPAAGGVGCSDCGEGTQALKAFRTPGRMCFLQPVGEVGPGRQGLSVPVPKGGELPAIGFAVVFPPAEEFLVAGNGSVPAAQGVVKSGVFREPGDVCVGGLVGIDGGAEPDAGISGLCDSGMGEQGHDFKVVRRHNPVQDSRRELQDVPRSQRFGPHTACGLVELDPTGSFRNEVGFMGNCVKVWAATKVAVRGGPLIVDLHAG